MESGNANLDHMLGMAELITYIFDNDDLVAEDQHADGRGLEVGAAAHVVTRRTTFHHLVTAWTSYSTECWGSNLLFSHYEYS